MADRPDTPFQLDKEFGRDYEFKYEKAPDNKYEWAIDPYHDSDARYVKSLSANKFTVEMSLGSNMGLNLTIVFDERSLGRRSEVKILLSPSTWMGRKYFTSRILETSKTAWLGSIP